MYAFNLYIEEGTMSPEPLILFSLDPEESTSFSQHLVFKDDSNLKPTGDASVYRD